MQKQCPYCLKYFTPNSKLKNRQVTCGVESCKNEHQKQYKKEWWSKNKHHYKDRYKETEVCPSRTSESRSRYRKQAHVKQKHAEYMRNWRKKKKLEKGKSVRCTNCDIEFMSIKTDKVDTDTYGVNVRCTDTDILISLFSKRKSNKNWDVRCTNLDRLITDGVDNLIVERQ